MQYPCRIPTTFGLTQWQQANDAPSAQKREEYRKNKEPGG